MIIRTSICFQLPLSGSHFSPSVSSPLPCLTFQLPLSGSPGSARSSSTPRTSTSFNSLSRDHQFPRARLIARSVSFNSLSRDHRTLPSGVMMLLLIVPFNSLSRDHIRGECINNHLFEVNFQLPLSGSP